VKDRSRETQQSSRSTASCRAAQPLNPLRQAMARSTRSPIRSTWCSFGGAIGWSMYMLCRAAGVQGKGRKDSDAGGCFRARKGRGPFRAPIRNKHPISHISHLILGKCSNIGNASCDAVSHTLFSAAFFLLNSSTHASALLFGNTKILTTSSTTSTFAVVRILSRGTFRPTFTNPPATVSM
jgi:hypothetical protein